MRFNIFCEVDTMKLTNGFTELNQNKNKNKELSLFSHICVYSLRFFIFYFFGGCVDQSMSSFCLV